VLKRIGPVALAAAMIALLFYLMVLSSHAWNPRAFILERPPGVPVSKRGNVGYDGQYSYMLAINPLGSVRGLDQPAYRYQRIVYPMLVKLFSLGRADWVPWVMVGVNLAAAVLGCAALGVLIARRGRSPWLALVFILSIGYLLAIRMDLNEPLAFALALSGWLAFEDEALALSVVLFALSGLSKEVGLVFPATLAVYEFFGRHGRKGLALLASFIPYVLWYVYLFFAFGATEEARAQSHLMWIPFSGIQYVTDQAQLVVISIWVLGPALLAGAWAAWDAWRGQDVFRRDAFMVVAQAALVAVMPQPTWVDPLAILRIGLGLLAALLVWLARAHPRWLPVAAGLWLSSGLMMTLIPGLL
jgi:hypothetical protein